MALAWYNTKTKRNLQNQRKLGTRERQILAYLYQYRGRTENISITLHELLKHTCSYPVTKSCYSSTKRALSSLDRKGYLKKKFTSIKGKKSGRTRFMEIIFRPYVWRFLDEIQKEV